MTKNELTYIQDPQKLTPEIIKTQIDGGQNLSQGELNYFLAISQKMGLNPFTKEVYAIKYGDRPQIVVAKKALERKAQEHPQFDFVESGIVYETPDGNLHERKGSICPTNAKLVGGWCEVGRKDRSRPYYVEASMREYSSNKNLWSTKPATMITKVAQAKAYREFFPDELGGAYVQEEFDNGTDQPKDVSEHHKDFGKPVGSEDTTDYATNMKKVIAALGEKAKELGTDQKELASHIKAVEGVDIRRMSDEQTQAILGEVKKYQPEQEQEPEPLEVKPNEVEDDEEIPF